MFFKERKKCGFLHPIHGTELTAAKYECKDPAITFIDQNMYIQFASEWVQVENNKIAVVDNPIEQMEKKAVPSWMYHVRRSTMVKDSFHIPVHHW